MSIDTLHIDIPVQPIARLTMDTSIIDRNTGELKYTLGYKECIKVKEYRDRIRLECSLPKLLKGQNIYSLSYEETLEALRQIGEKLGVDIWEGIIRRLDIEFTIETKYEVAQYFKFFSSSNFLTRSQIKKTSLYYQNTLKTINFYDKVLEIKKKKEVIPQIFQDKNLMRFECRYMNNFLKQHAKNFNLKNFTIESLKEHSVYIYLVDLAFKEYEAIEKIRKPIKHFNIQSKSLFQEQLARLGIEAFGGINKLLDTVDALRAIDHEIPKEYFSRRKKELNTLCQKPEVTEISGLIRELDFKINNIFKRIKNE